MDITTGFIFFFHYWFYKNKKDYERSPQTSVPTNLGNFNDMYKILETTKIGFGINETSE